jgi:hypothetical protein
MKKLFLLFSVVIPSFLFGQIGATAPNFTVTDIDGNTHNLYDYLNSNKVVLLDVSATWCGPCWGFHTNHYLKDLYTEFGPTGTNQIVVLFYEGDAGTNMQDLDGTDAASQGDWITGTPYPIVNETPLQLNLNIYAPLGFPTINVICPSDKKIKSDLWDLQAGTPAASLENMRQEIINRINTCATLSSGVEETAQESFTAYPNPASDVLFLNNAETINRYSIVDMQGKTVLTDVYDNGINVSTLAPGVYMVAVETTETTSYVRFIKK